MTIYLGPVGNQQALPSIGRGIGASLTVPSAVHQIAGRGGRVVDRFPGAASRVYGLARSWLTADELSIVEAMYLGAYGPGPFVLTEPWRRNMLSANQSSGTDVLADTTGFAMISGTSLTSSTAQADQGRRSAAWSVTAANRVLLTGSDLTGGLAVPTVDIPVLPSTSYSVQVRGRTSTSTATLQLRINWYNAAGTPLSTSTGTTTGLVSGSFTTCSAAAQASPSTAALARIRCDNTVMGAAQTLYLDQWQFEQSATTGAWVLGTGVPRVSFTDELSESYNVFPSIDAGFTLQEVGAA